MPEMCSNGTDDSKDFEQWLQGRGGVLPSTLDELNTLPIGFRREVVRRLPRDTVAELWVTHFDQFISDRSYLGAQTSRLIRSWIPLIRTAFGVSNDDAQEALRTLEKYAAETLSRTESFELLGQLGRPISFHS